MNLVVRARPPDSPQGLRLGLPPHGRVAALGQTRAPRARVKRQGDYISHRVESVMWCTVTVYYYFFIGLPIFINWPHFSTIGLPLINIGLTIGRLLLTALKCGQYRKVKPKYSTINLMAVEKFLIYTGSGQKTLLKTFRIKSHIYSLLKVAKTLDKLNIGPI